MENGQISPVLAVRAFTPVAAGLENRSVHSYLLWSPARPFRRPVPLIYPTRPSLHLALLSPSHPSPFTPTIPPLCLGPSPIIPIERRCEPFLHGNQALEPALSSRSGLSCNGRKREIVTADQSGMPVMWRVPRLIMLSGLSKREHFLIGVGPTCVFHIDIATSEVDRLFSFVIGLQLLVC